MLSDLILTWNTSSHSDQVCADRADFSREKLVENKKISLGSDLIPEIEVQVLSDDSTAGKLHCSSLGHPFVQAFGYVYVLKLFQAAIGHLIPCDILS